MKLQALAATLLASTALIGGSALAQATMQPIPNPPEKSMGSHMKMHHMKKHHMMKKHAMKSSDAAATPAPAAPQ